MHTERLSISTSSREQMLDITDTVRQIIDRQDIDTGSVTLYCPHTTAAVTINESADPSVVRDIISTLHKLVPPHQNYTHLEGNSDAHIKSSLVGCTQTILIEEGKLVLGTWQGIFFCEFDGPRKRRLIVRID